MSLEYTSPAADASLAGFEGACIDIFVHAAQVLGIPKSIAEIYGLLYASPRPLPMDRVMERLAISKGSASQGLRWLREVGAIQVIEVAGDRRDHFVAETRLRQLAGGFLREQIEPHLRNAGGRLDRLQKEAVNIPSEHRKFQLDRAAKIRRWHRFAKQVLPLFLRVAEKV
jgi:HTH-type transcriptional regulator, glycine betaine synthesis regulator